MAGRATAAGRAWIPILVACGALATAWVVAGGASARTGTTCAPPDATFNIDDPGTRVQLSAGYRVTTSQQVDVKFRGTDLNGEPIGGGSSCGYPDPWNSITVYLGDRADSLRMDARKPRIAGYQALPDLDANAYGGGGGDTITGHKGRDNVYSEGGPDVIDIKGGGADFADCGDGEDKVIRSNLDNTANCEKVVG